MAFSMNPLDWGKGAVTGVGNALSWTNANLNPFNPAVTQRTGEYWGNVISNNQLANRAVMKAMPVLDPLARGTYNLSGMSNYQTAAREAERGNLRGAVGQALLGGVTTVGTAASLGGGAGALRGVAQGVRGGANPVASALAGMRGTRLVPKGSFSSPAALRAGIQQPVTTTLQNAGKLRTYLGTPLGTLATGAAFTGALGLGGGQAAATPVAAGGPSTLGMTADRLERGPRGASYTDAQGNVMRWNPRSGIYEVSGRAAAPGAGATGGRGKGGKGGKGKGAKAGTVAEAAATAGTGAAEAAGTGADTQLEALSPEEYESLLAAAREAERGYQESINRIGRDTALEERNLYDYMRGVGREVAGERQDVASALAQLGMDTSPASGAYADYMAASGQRRVAARRGQSAGLLQDLAEQRRRAEALRVQQLADLERQRISRQARATVGRAANFSS